MEAADLYKEVRATKNYDKAIELVPYANLLGIRFEYKAEELLFTLPFAEKNIGNTRIPALHGGVLGSFMVTAATIQLMWFMESLDVPKVIDFNIDYTLSGRPQDTFATCKVAKLGKRIANVQIEAWQDKRDQPIAIARSHFKVFRDA